MSHTQLFSQPAALPLYSIESLLQFEPPQRVLIVAPHPDDECLGCGGAVALLHQRGCEVRVLVLSDGTMSHPNSRKFPASVLQQIREAETSAAMVCLGLSVDAITFLGLQDGAVPTSGAAFDQAVAHCAAYLKQIQPQLVYLPWRFDPHSDHRASWQIVTTALNAASQPVRCLEYPIWDWDVAQRGQIPDFISVWRLDISSVVAQKRQAIQAYRSQITDLIDDDPDGFRLSSELIQQFEQPWELYFEEREDANPRT